MIIKTTSKYFIPAVICIVYVIYFAYHSITILQTKDLETYSIRPRFKMKLDWQVSLSQKGPLNRTEEVDYFKRYWYKQHNMRIDYEFLKSPCKNDMIWTKQDSNIRETQLTSVEQSKVTLGIKPAGQYSRLIITSYTRQKRRKYIGGDSWLVYVHGETSVPVNVIDNMDGTYEAFFLIMEPGFYSIDLILDYSLCDGYKDPPPDWFASGTRHGKHQPNSILPGYFQVYSFLHDHYPKQLTFTVVYDQITNDLIKSVNYSDRCFMTDGYGRWLKTSLWKEYLTKPSEKHNKVIPHQKGLGKLWIVGDSVTNRLYVSMKSTKLCNELFSSCENLYYWTYLRKPGDNGPNDVRDNRDFSIELIINELKDVLNKLDENSALILNYGIHPAEGISFKKFQQLIDAIVVTLLDYRKKTGPKGHLIWKTTTALNSWRLGHQNGIHRRFLTPLRIELFNSYSTSKMCEAGIDIMDVYPISYSFSKFAPDGIHYTSNVFKSVENLIYNTFNN